MGEFIYTEPKRDGCYTWKHAAAMREVALAHPPESQPTKTIWHGPDEIWFVTSDWGTLVPCSSFQAAIDYLDSEEREWRYKGTYDNVWECYRYMGGSGTGQKIRIVRRWVMRERSLRRVETQAS